VPFDKSSAPSFRGFLAVAGGLPLHEVLPFLLHEVLPFGRGGANYQCLHLSCGNSCTTYLGHRKEASSSAPHYLRDGWCKAPPVVHWKKRLAYSCCKDALNFKKVRK
jgi:hypothetical protein